MKNKAILCLAAMALMLAGCSGESTDDSSVGISEAETTSSVEGMTFGNEQDITEPVVYPEDEKPQYSEQIQLLMQNVPYSGDYCEYEDTDIIVYNIMPDYEMILGDKISPESYTESTAEFNGYEIPVSAQEQAEKYLRDSVQFLFAKDGRVYFSVAQGDEPEIYRVSAFTKNTEHVITADKMGYDFSYFLQANEFGYVWRCQDQNGDYSTYGRSTGGELYCLDTFLEDNPDIGSYVFNFNEVWYEDYPVIEFGGKSDIVPCVFRYYLYNGGKDLVEFNANNLRSCAGEMIWDSCAPNALVMPFSEDYAVNCRYHTPTKRVMYQYNDYLNGPEYAPCIGYVLDMGDGSEEPEELFSLREVVGTPVIAEWLAAAEYRVYNGDGSVDSYMAVLDYHRDQLTSVRIDTHYYEFGYALSDGEMIFVPQNDGSIAVIRKRN